MPGVLSKVLVPAGEWPSSKKRKGLNALSDLAVWGCPDNDIIDAAEGSWRSDTYDHYNVEVCRVHNNLTDPPVPYEIVFKFSCKYHHPDHAPHYRPRTKTGDGTTKLRKGAEKCNQRRLGHSADDMVTSEVVVLPYSEARHRAILALWSAHSHRSFASLTDKFHRMEVEYLRPGTTLPSSSTISRDIKTIYAKYAPRVREYFLNVKSAVHLAIDGWTSPISESYLGIIAVWFDKLEIHRCILEFVRLTSGHTGEYLADQVASCIRRYALEDKILAAALDNASNNLTLVRHLQQRIPNFLGERSYVRCLAHILNLMAKAFMLPYSRPSKRTKQVLARTATDVAAIPSSGRVQEFILAQQLDALPESDELEAPNSAEVDEGKFEHDTLVAQASVVKAIEQLYAMYKIAPTRQQLQSAQGIMPKVAGLARRVDESTALTIKFHEAISLFPALKESGRKALSRRIPTRWGSDRHALDDHIHLRQPVQWITGQVPELKLQSLALNEDQWPLAEELNEVLEVFEVPTERFSAGSVPLVHDVLPKLIELKETLETIRASTDISPVTRVGAQAALNVFDKYMNNMSICEVYFISLVMCPDVKLNWLRKHYDNQSIERIRQMIIARFHITNSTVEGSKVLVSDKPSTKSHNRWLQPSASAANGHVDSIEAYLDSDTVSLAGRGGLLLYWSTMLDSTPRIARFALNYLTAPATSVDAERAFSAGRLTVNHLQHNMSSQTFEAKMALGSWYNTPLLPDIEEVASVIDETM